ncbi:hypothetical protein MBANPS3_005763 [Mucor bainieri]
MPSLSLTQRKLAIKPTCTRKLYSLPQETFSMICNYLAVNDLQQLSLANKNMRASVMGLSRQIALPVVMPRYLEIQCKITRVLNIRDSQLSYDIFHRVIKKCNIRTIKTHVALSRYQIESLVSFMKQRSNVHLQIVSSEIEKWKTAKKQKKTKFGLSVLGGNLTASTIDSVDSKKIPGTTNLVYQFNKFRSSSIVKLQQEGRLSNPVEALSLNGILLTSCASAYNVQGHKIAINTITEEQVVTDEEKQIVMSIVVVMAVAFGEGLSVAKRKLGTLKAQF